MNWVQLLIQICICSVIYFIQFLVHKRIVVNKYKEKEEYWTAKLNEQTLELDKYKEYYHTQKDRADSNYKLFLEKEEEFRRFKISGPVNFLLEDDE